MDLSKQQQAETEAWYAPSMYNIVQQDGKDVHLVIKPDKGCVVNSGLASARGARMAEMSYSRARATQQQRLTHPMVWRYGQMQPTSWEDALDLVARVTVAVIKLARRAIVSPITVAPAVVREHLGHRQAPLRRDEGEEYPHSQRPA